MTFAVQLLVVLVVLEALALATALVVARYHRALAVRAESKLRRTLLDLAQARNILITEGSTLDEIETNLRLAGHLKPDGSLRWSKPSARG